ncbi:DUF4190 domain-containing protein [Streptomyces jeddahensis]|uniref:DUF4190 domain-containing protein n=1 Tax=Streptomyces jeddahensis TaxID=1716141 RepID=A0A177HVK5_9ACTN|nr:DUF4190 domain-containing protein [Streptomyces jeddahensis]OAH14746.1 hypothetical protein STSP_18330 [Streptomyces jeddahensis]
MSDPNAQPGGFGPPGDHGNNPYGAPQQPPTPPTPGYGYPGPATPPATPGYGYPGPATPPAVPPATPYGAPGYAAPTQPSNGMGTTGLVLGIIGVVCTLTGFLIFFGIILGILAIIFGAIGRGKANRGEATNKGAATTGLVCGIVATVLLPLLGLLLVAVGVIGGLGAMS